MSDPLSHILFDHIAFGVWEIAQTTPFLVGELGGRPYEGGPGNGFRGGQWSYPGGGRLEVLEPTGPPDGFLHRFLRKNGAGFHHVTFKVPDLSRICGRARDLGYTVVGYDDSAPAWKEAFLHPKEALGIVVQMVESDPDFQDTWGPDWNFPPAPPASESPVTIVGLRLSAQEPRAVARQWGDLLEAQVETATDELVFRWPGSAMRIAVTLDPSRTQGPRWVEVQGGGAVLPPGPHEVLGARFIDVDGEDPPRP